jgi:phosphatidylserine/phosphatidylglycerophosphate/cardiolipin synthase-like enzyme
LLELIDRAQRELILVSYAAYKVPALVDALQRARRRSVVVRLILESTADSAGALTHDGADAFESLRESVEIYVWPIAKRPAGSRLHAKVAVADGEFAFVTSANFTGHALDQNLEVGVLVTGGQTPRRLMDHFHALIAGGTLARA